jgi:hypothetical protein
VLNCSGINSRFAGFFMQSCFDVNVSGGRYNQNGGNNGGTVEGYGISCATRNQVGDTDNARIKIDATTCLDNIGKGIDAHDCLELSITNNVVRGFLYNGIYTVNEGGSKNVSDVVISNNDIDGTTGNTTTGGCYAIQAGASGSASYSGSFIISNNKIRNITASSSNDSGIFFNNPDATYAPPTSVTITGNSLYNTANSGGTAIRTNSASVAIPQLVISGNNITQSVAAANGILCGPVTNVSISGNIVVTTSTFVNGIIPGVTNTAAIYGNVLTGTFSGTALQTSTTAYQTASGNILNASALPNIFNYNQSVSWGGPAAPSSGTWFQGSIVWNGAATNAAGQVGGWMRITTGSGNVLNTDWRAFAVTI